jgi:hypothetical protein
MIVGVWTIDGVSGAASFDTVGIRLSRRRVGVLGRTLAAFSDSVVDAGRCGGVRQIAARRLAETPAPRTASRSSRPS